MQKNMNLNASVREKAGAGLFTMRKQGWVPGILYGKKKEPQLLKIAHKDLEQATETSAGFNALFQLTIDGKPAGLVRIREYQAHLINRDFTHVDFQAIELTEKIEVEVPIRLVGTAKGVKDEGGVLEQQRRSLHLKCLVSAIPEHIDIDIAPLTIGMSIHADDLKLPEGVEFPHETNFTVCAVVPPTKEEEAKPAVDASAVIVESEKAGAAPAEGAAKEGGAAKPEAKKETKKEEKK